MINQVELEAEMSQFLASFAKDEGGAVTVDWVVITAAIVLLAALVGTGIRDEAIGAGHRISVAVATVEITD
ncbi:hypothetical protein [Yoonia sp. MH D7]